MMPAAYSIRVIFFIAIRNVLFAGDCIVLYRLSCIINESCTELTHSGTVDSGASKDVSSLLESDPFGYSAIHSHMSVSGKQKEFLTIQPPHCTLVGSDGKAYILDILFAVYDGYRPEDDTVSVLVQSGCKTEELDKEMFTVESMPFQLYKKVLKKSL